MRVRAHRQREPKQLRLELISEAIKEHWCSNLRK